MSAAKTFLSDSERETLLAIATTALPAGRKLPAADSHTVSRAEAFLSSTGTAACTGYRGMLAGLQAQSLATTGHRFSALPLGRRMRMLEQWDGNEATHAALRGLLAPVKLAYFDDQRTYDLLGCTYGVTPPTKTEENGWESQIVDARTFDHDEELEADAVVVGTGAGGAVMARELAEAGWAVVMIEEGQHFTRKDFTGRTIEMTQKLYRKGGLTVAVGNAAVPIPIGKGVGGTTMINAGTCFRAPETTFASWRDDMGLPDFSSETMDGHYRRVEAMLRVTRAEDKFVGGPGRIIARGCDALGYSHKPLNRNAPDCDGQGYCCMGCPTDAKRSTNVSYVPAALQKSAQLITGVRIDRVTVENGRAVGVSGVVDKPGGKSVRVHVRARVTVLACGSLTTPRVLLNNGLANSSGEVGRNLSIHPASAAFGVFDESVDGSHAINQGYSIDHFRGEGILFEGGSAPPEILASMHTGFGPAFVDLFERFDHICQFGFMVKDTSRGRVRERPDGEPLITYRVNEVDRAKLQRGLEILCRVLLAAGAREVHTPVPEFARLRNTADLDAMTRATIPARAFDLSAWHPLGTCRMGNDPLRSVVNARHETHDVRDLFITDGSSVPTSLGVNPQLTIMAMATRAAGFVSERLG